MLNINNIFWQKTFFLEVCIFRCLILYSVHRKWFVSCLGNHIDLIYHRQGFMQFLQ